MLMLEDEVMLAQLPPLREIRVVEWRPCSLAHCNGHVDRREMEAVHHAIESCYAPLRD